MTSLEDLLKFIRTSSLPLETSYVDWEKEFQLSCPGWENLVRDETNWPAIENERPKGKFLSLYHILLKTAGVGLAIRWFKSRVKEQAEEAREWLLDLDNLDASVWNQLTEEMKEYVVYEKFDRSPGEPFKSLKELTLAIEHCYEIPFRQLPVEILTPFLPIGYVPSGEISRLRVIVKRAGDKKFLQVIDNMVAQREKACQVATALQPLSQRIPYSLTRDERELVARVMDKARGSGYLPTALPPIFLSYEAPPLFVAYPELEEESEPEDENMNPLVPRNRERWRPETISIEEVLGCYTPNPQIILYARGLRWFAKNKSLDEGLLRAVVIVHEIGHWVTHLLPKPGIPEWPLDLYKLTGEDVHEGWAQLITWWVAEEVKGDFKRTFEKLNSSQPAPYQVYKRFKDKAISSVMASLEKLRELRWPARVEDWERFCL